MEAGLNAISVAVCGGNVTQGSLPTVDNPGLEDLTPLA
jgi:hypothetical protein